jgi:hypothetical protein
MCVGEARMFNSQASYTLGPDEYYVRSAEEMWNLLARNIRTP